MKSRIAAVAWIVGAASFFVAHIVTQLDWPTPYSWAGNNISDLGNLHCQIWDDTRPRYVCSPAHAVMNTGVFVEGALVILGRSVDGFTLETWSSFVDSSDSAADRRRWLFAGRAQTR
ncbi:DUF998 domain-containing protein [Fodinicola feengrottensis]|uniref:hypothetical protein n=1 Tax=Fodinicola feengrottensis TaxID=435914 RepID=UPI0013D5EDF9|nr:hypothetical protein [Fodinicola feengrottensis]